jgi:hypothetical protein
MVVIMRWAGIRLVGILNCWVVLEGRLDMMMAKGAKGVGRWADGRSRRKTRPRRIYWRWIRRCYCEGRKVE